MEDELPEEGAEIMLVLESTLFMVPWAMLKGSCNPEIFSERYVYNTIAQWAKMRKKIHFQKHV